VRTVSRARRVGLGVAAGVLAGGVAVGVGQLVAGIVAPDGSPIVAVGQLQIDHTPPWLKNFAIREFGSNDKRVLLGGIAVVLAALSAVAGVAAMRRIVYGFAGLAVLAAVGLYAVATRPTDVSAAPTLAAVGAGTMALWVLVRAANHRFEPSSGLPSAAPGEHQRAPVTDRTGGGGQFARPELTPDLGPGAVEVGASPRAGRPASKGDGWDRRQFLIACGAATGVAVASGLSGRLLADRFSVSGARSALRLPGPSAPSATLPAGVNLGVAGLAPFVTANGAFYRVDTALVVPQVPPTGWRLRIHGMVDRPISIGLDELLRRPLIEDYITLCCVSNPVGGPYIGNASWLGASLAGLLRQAGIQAGSDQLFCTSIDGFTSGTPVEVVMDGRDALLAVAMNGQPLPIEHGFPVRMVVPGLYGYVSATKWVTDIEVTTFAANNAYWSQRGWSQQAPIKTESRIDVPSDQARLHLAPTTVAGVAWAQHKGVDAVEVRVDKGSWQQARLAQVPGIDTWRQWAWDWNPTPGAHLIEARATDATGYTQTADQSPPEPNGATGYPFIHVHVRA
jgi:DMSO/TMAO reductase YedYZ molybdopterin-dependent catalytic subunit